MQAGRDFLLNVRGKMGLDADTDFVANAASAVVDDGGATHVHYRQFYRGVRVWEGEVIVHASSSRARGTELTSEIKSGIRLGTTPTLSPTAALEIANRDLRPIGPYTYPPTAELIVYPYVREQVRADAPRRPNGELNAVDMERVITDYSLAYYVQTVLENGTAETRHTDYIIDAHTGKILKQWDSLQTAIGTGNSQYSGVQPISTFNQAPSSFWMSHEDNVAKYSAYNANHGTSCPDSSIYKDIDNIWGDGSNYVEGSSTTAANGQTPAVDAHYGTGKWADYFYNIHGRTSGEIHNCVHYSSNYDNAFLGTNCCTSSSCICMFYGDGSSFTTLTSIDVVGHELTHVVTSNTAGLTYSGESGGLNESMSDIHATMLEFYARGGSGSTIGNTRGTWTIGEQLSSTPLRYMYKPSRDGASPDAWYSGIGSIDVHYSSGPSNRMFYFLSQGASSTAGSDFYSPYRPCGMTGIGNDHAARIAYRALASYMTPGTNYADARTAYLNAAATLYGTATADYAAVQNAFNAINVGAGATTCGGGG
jgi:Zn-dependent metalloprotease